MYLQSRTDLGKQIRSTDRSACVSQKKSHWYGETHNQQSWGKFLSLESNALHYFCVTFCSHGLGFL